MENLQAQIRLTERGWRCDALSGNFDVGNLVLSGERLGKVRNIGVKGSGNLVLDAVRSWGGDS